MARRRLPFRVAVPVLLMAIVAVLAGLQYRWLGQVSEAERARMHETMTARVEAFAGDLDHEVARVYVAFQVREAEMAALGDALGRRYQLWREGTRYPDLVTGLYIARADGTLQRFDLDTRTLEPASWPDSMKPLRIEQHQRSAEAGRSSIAFHFPGAINTKPLAVSVLLPFERPPVPGAQPAPLAFPGVVLVTLSEPLMTDTIVPALAREHLGDTLDEYRMVIVDAASPSDVVYGADGDRRDVDVTRADVKVGALSVRANVAERVRATELRAATMFVAGLEASGRVRGPETGLRRDHLTVLIQQPHGAPPMPYPPRVATVARAAAAGGVWQVLLKHRAGSLEAAVRQVRRRNLAVSFGMLSLLAVSVGLVLVSARRAERLASQQMDFVATVSHELRTPLAVIRSAGQNLSAGVVQDTKRYGELIEAEGRRLTEMIEQTLALAGLSGDRRPLARNPVDVGDMARSVAASPETSAHRAEVAVELRVAHDLPLVLADEMLLRRGVQNLVANALKYGRIGGWLGLSVDAHRGDVRITVSDRGPGIAADELPHVFDPFFRGRSAVADRVQGNGLGLHLVRRIAEAHGGRVSVRTAQGEGASFTIHLPAAAEPSRGHLAGEQAQGAMGS